MASSVHSSGMGNISSQGRAYRVSCLSFDLQKRVGGKQLSRCAQFIVNGMFYLANTTYVVRYSYYWVFTSFWYRLYVAVRYKQHANEPDYLCVMSHYPYINVFHQQPNTRFQGYLFSRLWQPIGHQSTSGWCCAVLGLNSWWSLLIQLQLP